MKRLMIIGGGEWQVPLIRKAKEMGHFVVNTNLHPGSPGFECADVGLIADVRDKKRNIDIARDYSVDAVVTDQSDIAVPTVAYVSERLGLPSIGKRIASLFTNKHLMRKFCTEHQFPTPAYQYCLDYSEAQAFIKKRGLPVVVKPPANQSSRGVTVVAEHDGLFDAYELALRYSTDGAVLLEEYVGGIELTVEGIKLNGGTHHCLATSYKTHYTHNPTVAKRLWFSATHPDIDYDKLRRQHDLLISAMALPFGLTHAEYKYHQGKFYLIEVAARGGGTRLSSDVVPLMSGIDSNELLVRMALGEVICSIQPTYNDYVAALDFFEFDEGLVAAVVGVEQAASINGVIGIGLNVRPGDFISFARDDRSRHGYVIAYAKTASALTSLLAEVRETVRVQYE